MCALIGWELRHIFPQGDYNTEALIFKMAATQFLDVFKEKTSKMKENAVALIITCEQLKGYTRKGRMYYFFADFFFFAESS